MRSAVVIQTEDHSVLRRRRRGRAGAERVPPVDLGQDRFCGRRAIFFQIPPIEGTQRFVDGISRFLRFRFQTYRQLMHKPFVRSAISGRVDRFLTPMSDMYSKSEWFPVILGTKL